MEKANLGGWSYLVNRYHTRRPNTGQAQSTTETRADCPCSGCDVQPEYGSVSFDPWRIVMNKKSRLLIGFCSESGKLRWEIKDVYIYIYIKIYIVCTIHTVYIYTYSYINTIETRKHLQIIYTLYTSDKCRHLKHYSTKKWVKKGFSNQDKDVSFTGFGDFPLNPDHGRRSSFNFFVVQTHIRNHDHTRRMPGTENFLREWGNYEKSFLV